MSRRILALFSLVTGLLAASSALAAGKTVPIDIKVKGKGTVVGIRPNGATLPCVVHPQIPTQCRIDAPPNETIELLPKPRSDYEFQQWWGSCYKQGFHCTLSTAEPRTAFLVFKPR